MKKNNLLTVLVLLNVYSTFAQAQSPKDTTVILKNDDYSNFKKSNKVSPYSGTIDFDTSGNLKLIAIDYQQLTDKADQAFKKKDFQRASNLYLEAFVKSNDLGQVTHRYNLACCYAMTNKIDSAFFQLYRIAQKGKYYNYEEIGTEKYFKILKNDNRWLPLIEIVKSNAKKLEDELNSKMPQQD